ncbi:hypothetical protein BCR36DRAFT_588565 [Piromyces finnis]|uniref:L domain-like protein n=1 Tax=Piromyces finnis TaxID=1754191 RepID=A0A1Y1U7V7_9FUNG|nr:hypothetical protein BCR36DRAFT_588565 [Piromyces finnis]|eukprot:ORX34092.1 hypothetical protein BCR36DRAFT_588565 [Piromyces finnis]
MVNLQNNQLDVCPPFDYQDKDGLGKMDKLLGIYILTLLNKLSIAHNKIRVFPDLRMNTELKELHLGNNFLKEFSDIENLKSLFHLNNLNLKGNPVTKLENYKEKILDLIPSLKVLDEQENEENKEENNDNDSKDTKSKFTKKSTKKINKSEETEDNDDNEVEKPIKNNKKLKMMMLMKMIPYRKTGRSNGYFDYINEQNRISKEQEESIGNTKRKVAIKEDDFFVEKKTTTKTKSKKLANKDESNKKKRKSSEIESKNESDGTIASSEKAVKIPKLEKRKNNFNGKVLVTQFNPGLWSAKKSDKVNIVKADETTQESDNKTEAKQSIWGSNIISGWD